MNLALNDASEIEGGYGGKLAADAHEVTSQILDPCTILARVCHRTVSNRPRKVLCSAGLEHKLRQIWPQMFANSCKLIVVK